MAFRSQAFVIFAAAAVLSAETVNVKHDHLLGGGPGTLTISEDGIVFEETGNKAGHSRAWSWGDIQRLEVRAERVRLLGYEDEKWRGYRDREAVFHHDALSAFQRADAALRRGLGAKYLAAVAAPGGHSIWAIPVKLREGWGGSEGTLAFHGESVTYYSPERGASRSWPIAVVESVSSGDRYELTVHTLERDYRFQLKQPIPEPQYEQLWRAVNKNKSISFLKDQQQ